MNAYMGWDHSISFFYFPQSLYSKDLKFAVEKIEMREVIIDNVQ